MTKARVLALALVSMFGAAAMVAAEEGKKAASSPLDYKVKDIDGKETDLSQFKGKVVMVVNVASKCGLTPQYTALEKLYEENKDKGFIVVGFPANDFKGQEPGTNEEIKKFCTAKYNVTFPMMSKVTVLGEDKAPVYKFLTEGPTAGAFAGDVKWNFTKFLVGRDGKVVARFEPKVKPDEPQVKEAVEKALAG
jgi:glutathione peroxidase